MYRLPRRTVLVALIAAFAWTLSLRVGSLAQPVARTAVHPPVASAAGPSQVLRLHILANSDAPADQAAKVAVRDALLPVLARRLGPVHSAAQARAQVARLTPLLVATADRTLAGLGRPYRTRIVIGDAYFPSKRWGGVTLAAGIYPAVTVLLGKGAGQNWWCVLFPPLCVQNPLGAVTGNEPASAPELLGAVRPHATGFGAWLRALVARL